MQINSVSPSFSGVRIFSSPKTAQKMINSGRDVIVNLAEEKLSLTPKYLVATAEDATIARDAQRTPSKAAELYMQLIAKAERQGEGKFNINH